MDLAGITNRKFLDLTEIGIETIDAIPENFPLTALQDRIRQCVSNNQEFISPDLRSELLDVEYPIHFLDFETIAPAVPVMQTRDPMKPSPFSGRIMFCLRMSRLNTGNFCAWRTRIHEQSSPRPCWMHSVMWGLFSHTPGMKKEF